MKIPEAKSFVNPLILFTYPDVTLLLVLNGIIFSVFNGVIATISSLFTVPYPYLSQTDLGLVYLAIGGGAFLGSLSIGKLLDRDYAAIKAQVIRRAEENPNRSEGWEKEVVNETNFPIEKARLRSMPIYLAVNVAAILGYGWCLERRANIAVPLILNFISKSPYTLSIVKGV